MTTEVRYYQEKNINNVKFRVFDNEGDLVETLDAVENADEVHEATIPDANAYLLLPFDGVDEATVFEDKSGYVHTLSTIGTAKLDNGTTKFGSTSFWGDDNLNEHGIEITSAFNLNEDQFCFEGWFNPSDNTTLGYLFDYSSGWSLRQETNGSLAVEIDGIDRIYSSTNVMSVGSWNHVALVKNMNSYFLYVGGVSEGSFSDSATISTGSMFIGIKDVSVNSFYGSIDDLKLTINDPVYTSGFTPPTTAHELPLQAGWYDVVAFKGNKTLGQERIYWNGYDIVPYDVLTAQAVRTELDAELTYLMSLQNGLTTSESTMLLEIYRLLGLDPTRPLVVTTTKRTVLTEIDQDLVDTGTQTTVTRV